MNTNTQSSNTTTSVAATLAKPTTFVDWTPKQVYDRLVQAAGDGTFPSIDISTRACRYCGDKGCKCGFGLFISDELYDENMENSSAQTLLNPESWSDHCPKNFEKLQSIRPKIDALKKILPPWATIKFWQDIQESHDCCVTFDAENKVTWNKENFIILIKGYFAQYGFSIV